MRSSRSPTSCSPFFKLPSSTAAHITRAIRVKPKRSAWYSDSVVEFDDPAEDLDLPTSAGDAVVLETGTGKFTIACVGAGAWSVRRLGDPLYLGELRQVDTVFDYEAQAGSVRFSMTGLSLRAWASNL